MLRRSRKPRERAPTMMIRGSLLLLACAACSPAVLPAQGFPFVHGRRPQPAAGSEPSAEQIRQWVAELSHDSPLRRENALRHLIAAGEPGAAAVRPLCTAADPALSLRAQHVFGAVHGVLPEVHTAVGEAIASTREQPWNVAAAAARIGRLGPAAAALAQRMLAPGEDVAPGPLYTELLVRGALAALGAGTDRGDELRQQVLGLSAAAAEPLRRAAAEDALGRTQRLHALWLYGVVGTPGRAVQLARLLQDGDAAVRGEALALLTEAMRAEDFDEVAAAVGHRAGPERLAVAQAAARVVPVAELTAALRGSGGPQGIVAALALGSVRGEAAREALTEVLEGKAGADLQSAAAQALGAFAEAEATDALVDAYAGAGSAEVRAAAIASLRPRLGERRARVGVSAALFDPDAAVRLLAAEALSASEQHSVVPALILAAARDDGSALRARVAATLSRLVPGVVAGLGPSTQPWERWLESQGGELHGDDLPWYRASREAADLVQMVRSRIVGEFFDPGREEPVAAEQLDEVARKALQQAAGNLTAEGCERRLLERLCAGSGPPERLLAALGAIPFESAVADLVRLTDAAATAMVEHLDDPYSRLIPSNDAEGRARPEWLPGILEDDANNGWMVEKEGERLLVDFVLFDSPAFWAGVRRGDQLIRVGDTFASELSPKELRQRLREASTFTLLRDGWNRPHAFELVPDQSHHRRIVSGTMLPGGIGYVRLKMFALGCSAKVEEAVAALERQGMAALVLDLRDNPGGTVADATAICDLFLPADEVITVTEVRDGEDTHEETIEASAKGAGRGYPIAVLVNECSASASEMTAGSLQGNGRAVVVGQTSFGKGIGQSGQSFPGFSSETALGRSQSRYVLTLTMMRYYVPPHRRSIHGTGVQPDLPVRPRQKKGTAFDKAMRAIADPAFGDYVQMLQADHAGLCRELCRFDGGDARRYPDFAELQQKLARHVDADELRRLLREALRTDLLRTADDETFAAICCDVQEDHTLRAALRELCDRTDTDVAGVPEYADLR